MFRSSVLILSIYTDRMKICPFSKFPLQPCNSVGINWMTAYVVEPLRIMNLKRNEKNGNSAKHRVTLDILVVLQFVVSIAENSLKCFIVFLIYQEMRAVLRLEKKKKTPISLWPEYWSDWILDIVFSIAFDLHWMTLVMHLKATTEKNFS